MFKNKNNKGANIMEANKKEFHFFKNEQSEKNHLIKKIDLLFYDLQNIEITNASCVVMNFTLQFIAPEERTSIIDKIYAGLNPGGILILSEKLKHPSSEGNELLIDLHHEFKRRNGYSELEISQKREALEDVMRTDTYEQHQERLQQAGFSDVVRWFTCFNFSSFVALKAL